MSQKESHPNKWLLKNVTFATRKDSVDSKVSFFRSRLSKKYKNFYKDISSCH